MPFNPSVCYETNCAQTNTGQEPVLLDHAVVKYKFRPDILWSAGEVLTAGDSKYATEIAASLFPKERAEIFARSFNYIMLDPIIIVWEHVDFGKNPIDETISPFTSQKGTRQAVAMCIDREWLVNEFFRGESEAAHSYVHHTHPFYMRPEKAAMRPDMCGVDVDPSARSSLRKIEDFEYGEGCSVLR